ncbi:MAG: DUF2341 domain-containing protein [bacterium]|nr:DUF2341 domain-containing protein [bacterium]
MQRYHSLVFWSILVLFLSTTQAWGSGFQYCRLIDITNAQVSGGPHTNFPFLFNTTLADLKTTINSGKVTNANGFDIIFTSDAAGSTKLDHEIEKYTATTGEFIAWVRIPSLASGTNIYLFYGNSSVSASQENVTGVWDTNYKGVWHLKENAAGTGTIDLYQDSTSNNNDGDDFVSDSEKSGKINNGQGFDGSDDYIDLGSGLNIVDNHVTISAWSNIKTARASYSNDIGDNDSYKTGYGIQYNSSKPSFAVRKNAWWNVESPNAVGVNEWHYITGVYDYSANRAKIYVDGVEKNSASPLTAGIASSTKNFRLGSEPYASRYSAIKLDEVRISNIARSGGWITTEYNNQNNPGGFYSLGAETPVTAPVAPSNLDAQAVSGSRIDLFWTDNSGNEVGFKIERKTGAGGTYTQIATVGADVTSYSNTGLDPNTTYCYRVRAYNAVSDSGYSNEDCATTPNTAPDAPTNLNAQAFSSRQIDLSWADNSNNETGFKIERKTGAGGTFSQITTVGANVTSYSNTGLDPNTTYCYRVRAYNAVGGSGYSNENCAATPDVAPNAPANLDALIVSDTQIDLIWTDNSNNETGFKIERKTGTGGIFSQIATVGADVTSYSNTGLDTGTTYCYRARAYNAVGNSGYSNEDCAATPGIIPNAPSNLYAQAVSGTQIDLVWADNSDNETGFKIERKTGTGGIFSQIATVGANVTSYSNTVAPATTYCYRVRVYNAGGDSDYSNEHCAPNTDVPIKVILPAAALQVGSEFEVEIQVGTPANPVTDLFALSFRLNHSSDISPVNPINKNILPDPELLGDNLVFHADTHSIELLGIGLSRKKSVIPVGAYGYGRVARIRFNLSAYAASGTTVNFRFEEETLTVRDSEGNPISLIPVPASFTITPFVVWPGDCDNDGVVDETDILPVGRCWLETGPARGGGGNPFSWEAREATPWTPDPNATYADANGDGVVDEKEIVVIGMNWGKTHTAGNPARQAGSAPHREILSSQIDHSQALPAYQAMYQLLKNSPENKAVIQMKNFLAQLIEIGAQKAIPVKPGLGQNYPNPLNPETYIPFSLSKQCQAAIQIYDLAGHLVRTIDLGKKNPGIYLNREQAAYWDGRDNDGREVSSGIYFYRLNAGDTVITRKMIVLK